MAQNLYTTASDVYAFGLIVYEIITNQILYESFSDYNIMALVTSGIHSPIPEILFVNILIIVGFQT